MLADLTWPELLDAREMMQRRPFGSLRDNLHFQWLAAAIGGCRNFPVLEWLEDQEAEAKEVVEYVNALEPIVMSRGK